MPDDVFIRKGIIARRRLAQYLDADVAWRDLFPELFDAIEKEGKITGRAEIIVKMDFSCFLLYVF